MDVESRIAQASKAFGALHKAVFRDNNLSLKTKRKILWGMHFVSVALWS